MRKVLSFVLVLSLVLGSFGMAFAATPKASDIAGKACEDAVNVLQSLDVVSGYEDGTYKPEGIVTRAEMATLIVKALGLNDYAVGASQFKDCAGHWANGYIGYAASLGIISGRTATTFDPNAIVSYNEAATMLVKALGYSDSSLAGVYPASYVSKAKTLGILDDIQAGVKGANRGDVAIIIYQTLDANIGKTDKDGKWEGIILKQDGTNITYDNMLSRLDASVFKKDGVAQDKDGFFTLTKNLADGAVANVREYIGAYVTAYANDEGDILAIKEVKSTFLTGTFDKITVAADTTAGAVVKKGDTLFTAADDTEYTVKSDATINDALFLNSADVDELDFNTSDDYTVAVKISGKKITDIYSVSQWNIADDSHAALFDEDDASDIKDDNKLFGVNFKEDDNDDIDLDSFALLGVKSLDEIKKDNVVYVYRDNATDKNIARIEVGTEVVTGEITKVKSQGTDDAKYTVNGKVYKYSTMAEGDQPAFDAGDEVKFYLDYSGKIYEAEKVSGSADKLAVVIETAAGKGGLNGNDVKFELFLADGSSKIFSADADELKDAGVLTKGTGGADNVWTTTGEAITSGAIVKYDVDKNGLINAIEVADKGKTTTAAGMTISSKGYFDGFAIASDATIFTADEVVTSTGIVKADDDEFGVTTLDKVKGLEDVDAIYHYDSTSKKIDWMVINSGSSTNEIFAVYSEMSKISGGNSDYEVVVYVNGEPKAYEAASKTGVEKTGANNIAQLYLVKFDNSGAVSKLDASTGRNLFEVDAATTISAVRKNVVSVDNTSKTSITLDSDVIVYVYNETDDEWTVGGQSDIKKDVTDNTVVRFYDTDADKDGKDGDKVADVVIVWQK